MAEENEFPKEDGDVLYAKEINAFRNTNNYFLQGEFNVDKDTGFVTISPLRIRRGNKFISQEGITEITKDGRNKLLVGREIKDAEKEEIENIFLKYMTTLTPATDYSIRDFDFGDNGKYLYVLEERGYGYTAYLRRYTLTTPYDVTTMSSVNTLNLTSNSNFKTEFRQLSVLKDGSGFYVKSNYYAAGHGRYGAFYQTSVPWQPSGSSLKGWEKTNLNFTNLITVVNRTGDVLTLHYPSGTKIRQYTIDMTTSPFTITNDGEGNDVNFIIRSISWSDDGMICWLKGTDGIIREFSVSIPFNYTNLIETGHVSITLDGTSRAIVNEYEEDGIKYKYIGNREGNGINIYTTDGVNLVIDFKNPNYTFDEDEILVAYIDEEGRISTLGGVAQPNFSGYELVKITGTTTIKGEGWFLGGFVSGSNGGSSSGKVTTGVSVNIDGASVASNSSYLSASNSCGSYVGAGGTAYTSSALPFIMKFNKSLTVTLTYNREGGGCNVTENKVAFYLIK